MQRRCEGSCTLRCGGLLQPAPRIYSEMSQSLSLMAALQVVQVPEGVDFATLIQNAMDTYNVEISGGLGPSIGKVWRVGIMVRTSATHCHHNGTVFPLIGTSAGRAPERDRSAY